MTAATHETTTTHADPVEVFRARIEARAMLYAAGVLELHEVIPADDEYLGLPDGYATACREADVPKGYRVVKPPAFHLAESTIQAAVYLIKQNDPERFHRWLNEHSARERAAILQHIGGKS